MIQEMPVSAPIEYGEKEKKQAVESLQKQFEDFNRESQMAIFELLQAMIVVGNYGEDTLEQALNTIGDELLELDFWGANRDDRGENLALLSRQENGSAGKIFTVHEIRKILEDDWSAKNVN